MRADVYDSFGPPAEVLHEAQTEQPVWAPESEAGAQEVLIEMELAPIHQHDLLMVSGNYGTRPKLPAIGGSEGCGRILAVGKGVVGMKLGQRVACSSVTGTWAEVFKAPASMVFPIPEKFEATLAAQITGMPLAALMLFDSLHLQPGDWLVQNAADGAVGKSLAVIARERGVHVLNVVRSERGLQEMKKLGFEASFSTSAEGWLEEAQKILGKTGARAAVDSVGGEASASLLELVGTGGALVTFGMMSGQPMVIPQGPLIFRDITVRGYWRTPASQKMPAQEKHQLIEQLIQWAEKGLFSLPVAETFGLSEIKQAVVLAKKAGGQGKVLLRP